MSVWSISLLGSIRAREECGRMGAWRVMSPTEKAKLQICESAEAARFVRFGEVQPPPRELVGICMDDGARCIGEFGEAYVGEQIGTRVAVGWMLLE